MSMIQVAEERPLNIYRTEIPNIVFDIGLTCFELVLYAHLRRTAGPGGQCTKGVRRLSEETGMSTGQVSEVRRKLCEPRPELNGKPLIRVQSVEDERCKVRHHVTIVDIWRENFNRFDPVHDVNTPVQGENTPCSPGEHKKEPIKGSNAADAAVPEPSIKSKVAQVVLPSELDSDDFIAAWDDWVAFRAERKIKPYQVRGANAQIAILAALGAERAIAAIRFSIAQQYQGIYEDKKTPTHPNGSGDRNAGTYNAGQSSKFAGVERLA